MRENEKEREELKDSRPKTLLMSKRSPYNVLFRAFIAKPPLQITKITKQTLLQWGQIGETNKN